MQSRQSRNIFCAYLILCVLPFPVGCSPNADQTQTQNADQTQTPNADETQTQQLIGTWQGSLQGGKVTITNRSDGTMVYQWEKRIQVLGADIGKAVGPSWSGTWGVKDGRYVYKTTSSTGPPEFGETSSNEIIENTDHTFSIKYAESGVARIYSRVE